MILIKENNWQHIFLCLTILTGTKETHMFYLRDLSLGSEHNYPKSFKCLRKKSLDFRSRVIFTLPGVKFFFPHFLSCTQNAPQNIWLHFKLMIKWIFEILKRTMPQMHQLTKKQSNKNVLPFTKFLLVFFFASVCPPLRTFSCPVFVQEPLRGHVFRWSVMTLSFDFA